MKSLHWFRADLRLLDNPALTQACRDGSRGVHAVFCISPEQWMKHDWAPARVDFLLRNLKDLSARLAQRGIPLHVITTRSFADQPRSILRLMRETGCHALYANREYEWNEVRRDRQVHRLLKDEGLPCHWVHDQVLRAPGTVLTGKGEPYTVYSPFRRKVIDFLQQEDGVTPLPEPAGAAGPVREGDPVPSQLPGFHCPEHISRLWPAGERTALETLASCLKGKLSAYKEERDSPAADATSRLSPALALGLLSPRVVLDRATRANRGLYHKGNPGLDTWINQLLWREFYRHVMHGFPRVSRNRSFRPEGEYIPWRDAPTELDAWREGRTGVPIVDAGMRELAGSGWMHNRLRMITAMFLSKNLLIDWREGEAHFMRHLVDGDLANNNGGWQWSASTGTDAAPYFRLFNPWTQGKRFDPEGRYTKTWLPELADVPAEALHDPTALQLCRPKGYPPPIVDHSFSRDRAIRVFRLALQQGKEHSKQRAKAGG